MIKQIDTKWWEGTYIFFKDIGKFTVGGKTNEYRVQVKEGGTVLGTVHWFKFWRKYCFFPLPDMAFDPQCLIEIAEFTEMMTKQYKDKTGWKR